MKTDKLRDALEVEVGYQRFLQSVTLVAVGLNNCSCRLDRLRYLSQFRMKSQESRRSFEQTPRVMEIGEKYFDAEVAFNVKWTSEEKGESNTLLSVEFVLEAHFHADTPEPVQAQKFAESQLLTILLPYARYFVSSVTSQMSIPPVLLPLSAMQGRVAQHGKPEGRHRNTGKASQRPAPKPHLNSDRS
jgi:preprotein translocase subunit SecB